MNKYSGKHVTLVFLTFLTLFLFLATRINFSSFVYPYRSGIDCIPIIYPSKPPLISIPIPTAHYGNYTCPITPKILPNPGPKVALASFPGSGNTWVRFLLEQSTGFYTGSVYFDRQLWSYGFLERIFNSSVIAIKTHESYGTINKYFTKSVDYTKCILVLRDPKLTLVAEINRFFTNDHTKSLKPLKWKSERVQHKMLELVYSWKSFLLSWLQFNRPLLVVEFEKLVTNYRTELERILNFLELDFNPEGMKCLEHGRSGYFQRFNKTEPYFSPEVLLLLQHVYTVIQPLLHRHNMTFQDI